MSAGKPEFLVIHGWTVFAHPLFLAQIEALARQVETLKQKDPSGYVKKNASKRLAAITKFRLPDPDRVLSIFSGFEFSTLFFHELGKSV
ncbi:MAG: type II toxin-antitoxin system YhaV family toxin [Ferrovum myxofaciens]|nr:type II toxin-antitoxin system YhaV family toxin [Ferrovum myxofaciens]MBU6995416.1 type II toxin-antitoxin system YhaV family toxin [Ferrovum myxofaciens]